MPYVERSGDVFVLYFGEEGEPDSENAFHPDWIDRVDGLLDQVEKHDGPAALVTTGLGKFYSTGLDTAWVVANTDHYSKKGAPKSSGKGSAEYCLDNKGGGCTDQHALFIALCRARGIPTRLHFGSNLRPQNAGKDVDPGYRCWVQYFVPNYGWVPTDLSAADTNPGKESFFYSGLDERRIRFAEGRDLELNPRQTGERVNLLIVAYVEVDGRPHTSFDRVLRYTEAAK